MGSTKKCCQKSWKKQRIKQTLSTLKRLPVTMLGAIFYFTQRLNKMARDRNKQNIQQKIILAEIDLLRKQLKQV
jgi:hypothetical protein